MTISYRTPAAGSLTLQVAEEIRAMMARKRVNQAELARRLGVSQPWVSDRLRGTTPINFTDLERIAGGLGVRPLTLIPPERAVNTSGYSLLRPADTRPPGRPEMLTPRRTARLAA